MHDTTAATTALLILLAWGGVGALFFWERFLRDALRRFRRRSRAAQALIALGIAALVAVGGIKPDNPPLRTPPPDIPSPSLTTNQCLAGFALVNADTNATFSLAAPTNAVVHTNWLLRGASRDAFAIESTDERPWSFLLGTNRLHGVWVSAGGTIAFSGPFDSTTGPLPDDSAPDHLAPFHATLGIVPAANWHLLPTNAPVGLWTFGLSDFGLEATGPASCFWHDTTEAGSLRLTWRNALFDRDANFPVSFQTELFPSGDFIYRYDLGDTVPTNAVIGAQNNGGGEAWTNVVSAQRVELRWRHFSGIEPGVADTDGDGLSDYDEVFVHGTDPARADSDSDGIADGGDSAPNNADANGDGIPDGAAAAAWAAHPFLAENAGFTNLVLTVVRGMAPPLRSGNAPEASALLDVGGLKIPLRTGDAIPLGLPAGVDIAAALRVRGNLPVRLQISPGPALEPLRLIDPDGIFSHGTSANVSARLSFPLLSLVPLTDTGTCCLHEEDTGAEFQAVLLPSGRDDALATAEIEGFELLPSGTLWLDGPEPPFATNTGTVTIRPPWLRWGTFSASASVHWCEAEGFYCHACGTVHTEADSCSHGANCAARFSDDEDCDCPPMFLRVNFDDDDLDDVEDRYETPDFAWEDELEEFRFSGTGDCCCSCGQTGDARARIAFLSSGLRLWSEDGTRLLTGDDVSAFASMEATAHSPTNGAFLLRYDILDRTGGVVRAMSRRFTAANIEILPDMDEDGDFDADDYLLQESLGTGGTWTVVRSPTPCSVRLRNACPADATLRVLWSTEGTNGPAFSTDSNLTTQYLVPNAATTNAPFALPNLVDEFLIDASRTSSVATLTYSLDIGGASPAVADSLAIRIVDIDLPDLAVRPPELASVEYDLSAASENVAWTLEDTETGNVIDWDYGPTYAPPTALALGDYEVSAYVWDVWEGGMEGTYRTATLRVADIAIEHEAYATIAGSAHRAMVSATVSNVTGAISWTIEPALENGARLLSSSSSANGTVSLNGGTNVWISPGSVVRDYLVTATCSTETNLSASATVYVGRVNIDGDFFRNGGFADHPAEASPVDFLSSTGMVIIANNDDDNGDERADFLSEPSSSPHAGEFLINGAGDLAKMHRLQVSPLAIPADCIPTNWTARLIAGASENSSTLNREIHLFWNLTADSQGSRIVNLSNLALRNNLGGDGTAHEIGVEGRRYGREYTVTLELLDGENSIASDTVRILVAPFIALPQTAVTKFVYTGIDNQWTNLNQTVHPALTGLVPWRSIGSMNFVQDFAELGVTAISTNHWNTAQDVILHLKQGHFDSEINTTNAFYSIGGGDGGNVETLPPTPGHPLGQIVVGNNIDDSLRQFLQRQKVQTRSDGTLVELDTSWLKVKHVDELFSIVPTSNGYRVLVADLQLAIDLLMAYPSTPIEKFHDRDYPATTESVYWQYVDNPSIVQTINAALGQVRQSLSLALGIPESDMIRIPVFFKLEFPSYPYTPNSVNLLSVQTESGNRKLLIPDPLFSPIRAEVATKLSQIGYLPSQIVWIDSFESDEDWGNVHCITNSRRDP